MNRQETINRIDELYDNNCVGCDFNNSGGLEICRKCQIFHDMQKLGKQLQKPRRRMKELLNKGKDMTFNEVEELRLMEVEWKDIAKVMKIGKTTLEYQYKMWKESKDMATQGDLDKAKELLRTTGKTYQEIADETGVKYATVGYHGKKIRKEDSKPSQKPVQKREKPPESKDTHKHDKALHDDVLKKYNELSGQHHKTLEENNRLYKQLSDQQLEIEDLTNKVATLKMTVRTAEEMISSKNEQLRDRNADCDRLEEEISKLYEAYDMLKKWARADMEVERGDVYERRSAAV